MVSQSHAHLHITAQWLVPPIVWCTLRLVRSTAGEVGLPSRRRRPWGRPALALAALVTAQFFIGEEVLLLTGFALLLVGVGGVLAQPEAARPALRPLGLGLLLAGGLATIALSYPLRVQFLGPQHVPNGPFSATAFSADLGSFASYSPLALGGSDPLPFPDTASRARLTSGPAEYNAFLGLPLIVLALGCLMWLRRQLLAWALAFAAFMMAWLSLGPHVAFNGHRTPIPSLYGVLQHLPLMDRALPSRFALAVPPLCATLLALALHRAMTVPKPVWATASGRPRAIAVAAGLGLLAALAPLIPLPLPVGKRPVVPAFVTLGSWRECVSPGGVLVPVPLPTPTEPDAMRWATTARADFALPQGFFIGPTGPGGRAAIGVFPQPSSSLLATVAETGMAPPIGDAERAQFQSDLRYWRASCVALAGARHREELRATLDALLGPGREVGGTWAWETAR
jgi:hypothetical protein